MKIKDIMSKNIEIVAPETLLNEVAQKMQASDCGSVLVGKEDRLVGVITDRDLVLRCVAASHDPASTSAEHHRICGKALGHICAAPLKLVATDKARHA